MEGDKKKKKQQIKYIVYFIVKCAGERERKQKKQKGEFREGAAIVSRMRGRLPEKETSE